MVAMETTTVMKILILIFGEYFQDVYKGVKFDRDRIKEESVIRI